MICYECGNVMVREHQTPMLPGEKVSGHAHHFDHMTFVSRGSIIIRRIENGVVVREVTKNANEPRPFVLIEKGVEHELEAGPAVPRPHVQALRDAVAAAATGNPDLQAALEAFDAAQEQEGSMYHCIYAHRDPAEPDVILERSTGWNSPAYE